MNVDVGRSWKAWVAGSAALNASEAVPGVVALRAEVTAGYAHGVLSRVPVVITTAATPPRSAGATAA